MAIPGLKVLKKLMTLFILSILTSTTLFGIVSAIDSDNDGLADEIEIKWKSDPGDADTDDDGVLDGDEDDWNKDTDKIGNDINALDHDSDNDGIFDGTEKGITVDDLTNDTDLSKGHFIADLDPGTNTSMVHKDTDNDHLNDGEEDKNRNGRIDIDLNESDPNYPDRDGDGTADYNDDDIDGDDMPNEFEILFDNLDPYDPLDAILDDDLDGFTNLQEFYGDDNSPIGTDWSEPNNHTSTPDLKPVVTFLVSILQDIEANQSITFDDTKFLVEDSERDWAKGLKYTWNWGDGSSDKDTVHFPSTYSITHTYKSKGTYTVSLTVEDNFEHVPVSAIMEVFIKAQEGTTDIILQVGREYTKDNAYKDERTIRREGWIAYHIKDVRSGDKITIEFNVLSNASNPQRKQGVRVFIIPKSNLNVYKNDKPLDKAISREYNEKWQGTSTVVSTKGKIVIEADQDGDFYVIFDNAYYDEYFSSVQVKEPLKYSVKITREESNVILIAMIVVIVVVIIVAIMGGFFYLKLRESKGMTTVTREAAIETQRSLDREMAQLELEIQDSLQRQTVRAGPMTAMRLPQQQPGPPAPRPGVGAAGPPTSTPGTVPQTPAPVGAGTPGQQIPGTQPGQPAMAPKPGTTPGKQPMLPSGAAVQSGAGAPGPAQAPGQAPGTQAQPQMLPPAQTPTPAQPPAQPQAPAQTPAQPPAQRPSPAPAPGQPPAPPQQ